MRLRQAAKRLSVTGYNMTRKSGQSSRTCGLCGSAGGCRLYWATTRLVSNVSGLILRLIALMTRHSERRIRDEGIKGISVNYVLFDEVMELEPWQLERLAQLERGAVDVRLDTGTRSHHTGR